MEVIFVDLKNAFDTVDHQILIQKLALLGIRFSELVWLNSYLSKRSQFTKVNRIDFTAQNIGSYRCPPKLMSWPLIISTVHQ